MPPIRIAVTALTFGILVASCATGPELAARDASATAGRAADGPQACDLAVMPDGSVTGYREWKNYSAQSKFHATFSFDVPTSIPEGTWFGARTFPLDEGHILVAVGSRGGFDDPLEETLWAYRCPRADDRRDEGELIALHTEAGADYSTSVMSADGRYLTWNGAHGIFRHTLSAGAVIATDRLTDLPEAPPGCEASPDRIEMTSGPGGFPAVVRRVVCPGDALPRERLVALAGRDDGTSMRPQVGVATASIAQELGGRLFLATDPAQCRPGEKSFGDGVLFVSDDEAETWRALPIPASGATHVVAHPTEPGRVWIATRNCGRPASDGGQLLETVDNGATWSQAALPGDGVVSGVWIRAREERADMLEYNGIEDALTAPFGTDSAPDPARGDALIAYVTLWDLYVRIDDAIQWTVLGTETWTPSTHYGGREMVRVHTGSDAFTTSGYGLRGWTGIHFPQGAWWAHEVAKWARAHASDPVAGWTWAARDGALGLARLGASAPPAAEAQPDLALDPGATWTCDPYGCCVPDGASPAPGALREVCFELVGVDAIAPSWLTLVE